MKKINETVSKESIFCHFESRRCGVRNLMSDNQGLNNLPVYQNDVFETVS